MKLVNEWGPWMACLNNWAVLNQTTLGGGGGPAIWNNYQPTTDYTWVLPPRGAPHLRPIDWNNTTTPSNPTSHMPSWTPPTETCRGLSGRTGKERKGGQPQRCWGCGIAVTAVGRCKLPGLNKSQPQNLQYLCIWTKTLPPHPFKFAVAYYREIVCNKLFTSHLFRHDLLCTPSIIKQMKTLFFVSFWGDV